MKRRTSFKIVALLMTQHLITDITPKASHILVPYPYLLHIKWWYYTQNLLFIGMCDCQSPVSTRLSACLSPCMGYTGPDGLCCAGFEQI